MQPQIEFRPERPSPVPYENRLEAGESLGSVQAPTLLIVGGRDTQVLELNREAAAKLRAPYRLVVVPGATHLFEEPGALTHVAHLACSWFDEHLS